MNSDLVSAAILLLLVMDPFGNVPLVVTTMRSVPRERQLAVVLRECAIAYVLLLAFLFGGHAFLTLMHLSETSLSIAGGVILFLIALRMVFSRPSEGVFGDASVGEPLIVPLAIPAIAGTFGAGHGDADGVARPAAYRHLGPGTDRRHGGDDDRARSPQIGCSAGWASAWCAPSSG